MKRWTFIVCFFSACGIARAANWPATISSDVNLYQSVNGMQSNLSVSIDDSTTTIPVTSTVGFPVSGFLNIDDEVIFYNQSRGSSFVNVSRGADGTSSGAHVDGSTVALCIAADYHNALKDELIAMSTYFLQGEQIHIDTTNVRLGIGTSNPQNTLDIATGGIQLPDHTVLTSTAGLGGAVNLAADYEWTGEHSWSGPGGFAYINQQGYGFPSMFQINGDATNGPWVYFADLNLSLGISFGNVYFSALGITTEEPGYAGLEISHLDQGTPDTAGFGLHIYEQSDGIGLDLDCSSTTGHTQPCLYVDAGEKNNAIFGNVGIGTGTPTKELEVSGDVKADYYYGSGAYLTDLPSGGGGGGYSLQPATVTIQGNKGVTASTLTVSGAASLLGVLTSTNAANVVWASSMPASGVQPGSLGANVLASSVAVNSVNDSAIVGMSTSKLTGTITASSAPASAIQPGALGAGVIASSITLSAMYGAPTLAGTNFTALPGAQVGSGVPAANIAAGSLGGTVVASSITLAAMFGAPTLTGTNFTGIPLTALASTPPTLSATQTWTGGNTFNSWTTHTASVTFTNFSFTSATANGVPYTFPTGVSAGGYFKVNTSSAISVSATVAAGDVAAGSLGATVIASSISLASMYGAPSLTGTNFTSLPGAQVGSGVPAANIATGSLGASVMASSAAINTIFDAQISSTTNVRTRSLGVIIDNGSTAILTGGVTWYMTVPESFTPTSWQITAVPPSSSIKIDIWKSTYTVIPAAAATVVGSSTPTLTSSQYSSGTTSGWTTPWNKGDTLEAYVQSVTSAVKVILTIFGYSN